MEEEVRQDLTKQLKKISEAVDALKSRQERLIACQNEYKIILENTSLYLDDLGQRVHLLENE